MSMVDWVVVACFVVFVVTLYVDDYLRHHARRRCARRTQHRAVNTTGLRDGRTRP